MTLKTKINILLPFFILIALLGLLGHELFYAKPGEIPSALIGKPLPIFSLPRLGQPTLFLKSTALRGRVSLLNVWATWCYACNLEHEMLLNIQKEYHVPIYSINYKDDPDEAAAWLAKKGNPYVMTGSDTQGNVAIDLGIYGTPETFVIDQEGRIIYRHVGAITQKTWNEVLHPLIQRYEKHE
jgi:cytochrome c biogenesis protein CcmG/thiol:disulfide interchange protein DsbE